MVGALERLTLWILDIGCGWGGLAMYAAEKYGTQVLGITLSENQAAYASQWIARAGLGEQVSARLQDYRDLQTETLDKIASVGMFEHVGVKYLPEYFSQAYRLLKPGGLFLNHGISRRPAIRAKRKSVWQKLIEWRLIGSGSFVLRGTRVLLVEPQVISAAQTSANGTLRPC